MTTETKRYVEVANTILKQIGGGALYMIGARNKIAIDEKLGGVIFKTGKVAAGKANTVKIVLDYTDTYDVEFSYTRGLSNRVIESLEGIYFDQIKKLIEKYTGLYTSL